MPAITPKQKINQVNMFGGDKIEIVLIGDTFDECQEHALEFAKEKNQIFIPPFDHIKVVESRTTGLPALNASFMEGAPCGSTPMIFV